MRLPVIPTLPRLIKERAAAWTDRYMARVYGAEEAHQRRTEKPHLNLTQQQIERDGRDMIRRLGERGQMSPITMQFQSRLAGLGAVPGFGLVPENILGMPDFQSYVVGQSGIDEVIRWPIFHIFDYTAAGSTVYRFLNQDQGSATYGANGTNMSQASSFPASEFQIFTHVMYMVAQAIGDFQVASATAVVAPGELQRALYFPSHLEMWVGKKMYLNVGPLGMFPTGTGIAGGAFGGGAGAGLTTPVYNTGDKWRLIPPIGIAPLWIVAASANWNAIRALTTLGENIFIGDGYQVRAVH